MSLLADTVDDAEVLSPAPLTPGLITLHGNRLDWLAHAVMQWLAQHPLAPLEQEVVLVQSNGIAEWFKMEMAATTGVCAATRVELPSRFLWRTYRQVLGAAAVPRDSPLDKIPMTWRLMKVLPGLLELHDFAPVRGYLKPEEPERHLQLAAKLADLFDQYQNYRADWLQAWHAGRDVLIGHNGVQVPVPDEQRWQPLLWRAVLDTLEPGREQAIRPYLHQKVLERLQRPDAHYTGRVARRVVVFGMSHMPWSTLQVLAALSRYTQVLLAVPNPCRYYWGDIMDGRDLFRSQRQRQSPRAGQALAAVPLQDMHHHAHPLLAAWGRQGRDFIRLLDEFDDAAQTRKDFPALKIDLFDEDDSDASTPMLLRVQRLIRDLEPLDSTAPPQPWPLAPHDRSITFHVAHSRVRELEILHDQLLHLLDPAHAPAGVSPLQPRDVVVMVPDIEQMAPAIRAVFDQHKRNDPRHIPYDIADVSAKSSSPLVLALEWLLKLPRHRCGMSELVDVLEVPAVAARFGIDSADLPTLTQWMDGAGIRWGLNEAHRQALGLGACGEQNSAWFGLQRMLLGYAVGDAALDLNTTGTPWQHIAPYAEVGGLDAELAGSLAHLLHTLMDWVVQTAGPAQPLGWAQRARALLDALFLATDDTDRAVLGLLEDGLATWLQACEQARFDEPLPLADFAQAWLEAIEVPSLEHKFRAGGVTFCTLMPMRAVPFEVVCLLGMNDGDYPRRTLYSDFDLMRQKGQYRPGDRSRQYDDRQLMLEALLSARRALYIGWSGRSVRDNTEQPPSVLVSQLRDYLVALWGEDAIKQRTTEHPLQPFSRRYFEDGSALATYAHEWRNLHSTAANTGDTGDEGETPATLMPQAVPPLPAFVPDSEVPLTFQRLEWFLRNPVKAFFRDRFAIAFERDEEPDADVEPFQIDGLERYQLLQQQTGAWPAGLDASGLKAHVQRALERQRLAGALPVKALGEREQAELGAVLDAMAEAWHQAQCDYPRPAPRLAVRYQYQDVVLEDWVDGLHLSDAGADTPVWLVLQASKWLDKKGEPRPDKLLPLWLRLLGAAALGQSVGARAVGQDAWLEIRPMLIDTAQAQLGVVLEAWRAGMQQPLPVPLKTALALAPDPGSPAKARTAYEGDSFGAGLQPEGAEPCLARQYPDFAALQQDGQLADWAKRLYVPLLDWAKSHVTPHAY